MSPTAASAEARPGRSDTASLRWDDPFRLDDQLG